MTAKLIAEEGPLEGLVLSFDEGNEWVIGSDEENCSLLVEDPNVDAQQVVAKRSGDGISLASLSSRVPTLVNGDPLKTEHLLEHGDTIKMGSGVFRYYTEIGSVQMGKSGGRKKKKEQTMADDTEDTIFEESDVEDRKVLADIDFSLMETGRWMLKVIGGPNNGAEFFMEPGHSYIIGTSPASCDIVFHDVSVSRKHARLSIDSGNTVTVEDLGSRNGVLVDEKKIEGKVALSSNSVVSIGTTTFIVFDRENDRNTVITPLLPSIVKSLKGGDKSPSGAQSGSAGMSHQPSRKKVVMVKPKRKKSGFAGTFFFLVVVVGVLAAVGIGTSTLFKTKELTVEETTDYSELAEIQKMYPDIEFDFDPKTGELLMIGHVLTSSDRTKLLYNLGQLSYIKSLDDKNIIIDEGYWKQINNILSKNPKWRGVSMFSTQPGRFVLTGYLKTRKEAEQLKDYIVQNFPFVDRLERKVVVEEDVITEIGIELDERGFRDVIPEMTGGDVTLSGTVSRDRIKDLNEMIARIKSNPAIRSVKNFVVELEPVEAVVDLSNSYTVSGSSDRGGVVVNVVINGKILTKGDTLDGMTIVDITRRSIFLERDGIRYKIDYNR